VKGCLFVADLLVYIHYNWVLDTNVYAVERDRLQSPLTWLLSGFTATRPGALILFYRNVRLSLVRSKGGPPILAMTVRLEGDKRSGGESRALVYSFTFI
jgi:hypothetical protein